MLVIILRGIIVLNVQILKIFVTFLALISPLSSFFRPSLPVCSPNHSLVDALHYSQISYMCRVGGRMQTPLMEGFLLLAVTRFNCLYHFDF